MLRPRPLLFQRVTVSPTRAEVFTFFFVPKTVLRAALNGVRIGAASALSSFNEFSGCDSVLFWSMDTVDR